MNGDGILSLNANVFVAGLETALTVTDPAGRAWLATASTRARASSSSNEARSSASTTCRWSERPLTRPGA